MSKPLNSPPDASTFTSVNLDAEQKQILVNDLYYTLSYYPTPLELYQQVSKSCEKSLYNLLKSLDTEETSMMREKQLMQYKYCVLSQITPSVLGRKEMRSCMKHEMEKNALVAERRCKPVIERFEKKFNFIVKNLFSSEDWEKYVTLKKNVNLQQDLAFHVRCDGYLKEIGSTTKRKQVQDEPGNVSTNNHSSTKKKIDAASKDPFASSLNIDPDIVKSHMSAKCQNVLKRIHKEIEKVIPETLPNEKDSLEDLERKKRLTSAWHNVLLHSSPIPPIEQA